MGVCHGVSRYTHTHMLIKCITILHAPIRIMYVLHICFFRQPAAATADDLRDACLYRYTLLYTRDRAHTLCRAVRYFAIFPCITHVIEPRAIQKLIVASA